MTGQALAPEVSRDPEKLAERMLSDAYELVLGGWCQGTSAQDEMGRRIEPSSAFARSWSAAGALERVWRRTPDRDEVSLVAFERANLALAAAVKDAPQRWNDEAGRTHTQVLDALVEAPKLLYTGVREQDLLFEDLLDELDSHREIPDSLFENSA